MDAAGNVYVADTGNHRIRRIDPEGTILTVAGTGAGGYADGPATSALFNLPYGVTVNATGHVLVADTGNNRVRILQPGDDHGDDAECATALAPGAALPGQIEAGGDEDWFRLDLSAPASVAIYTTGNLDTLGSLRNESGALLAESDDSDDADLNFHVEGNLPAGVYYVQVESIGTATGRYTLHARRFADVALGNTGETVRLWGTTSGSWTRDPSTDAPFASGGEVEAYNGETYILTLAPGGMWTASQAPAMCDAEPAATIRTLAGRAGDRGFSGDGGLAVDARFNSPFDVAVDAAGYVYVADRLNHRIRRIGPEGMMESFAGTGVDGFGGDGGAAREAQLNGPIGVAVDAAGYVYVADRLNHRVRRIGPDGTIETIAGTGAPGFGGNGGPATSAQLNNPTGVAVDAAGNVYIADSENHWIRRIGAGGTITAYAGSRFPRYGGDGGPATAARLNYPFDVEADADGNVYVADTINHRVRRITPDGTIGTFAGTGDDGDSGDGGPATAAQIDEPSGLAVDGAGNVYVADWGNHKIRRIGPDGTITTFAGTGASGLGGDGRPAAAAPVFSPSGVAVGPAGRVYIAESGAHRIRVVTVTNPCPLQFDESGPGDQSHEQGADVSLTLPSASGGTGALTYSLTPQVPGLSFDPGTRRLTGTPTQAGDYTLTYTVTDEDGDATSYTFTISVAATPRGASFDEQRIITADADGALSVHAADLDGDGDPDLVSASWNDLKIAWYENLGGGAFSAQRIITTDADYARSVYAADLDGDGDPDLLSASVSSAGGGDKIAWYENLGGGAFSAQRVIFRNIRAIPRSVHAADLDGDGDPDVLSASSSDDKIAWYENLGGGSFSGQRVISLSADSARSVHAADLDGDGDPDVLSASSSDDKIAWYENLGGGSFSGQRVISLSADSARSVHAADLDGDGDPDVLSASASDDKVAWYENLGGGTFSAQRVITTDADGAYSVHAADLDGDGDPEVLSASFVDDKIAWYENLSDHGDDHGDAPRDATLVTASSAFLHGTLESGGDRDVFRMATGNGTLYVTSNGPTDTFGSVLGADGAVLAQDDESGAANNFRIGVQISAGTHYVEVRGRGGTTGPYTLSMEFVADAQPQFDESSPGDQSYAEGTDVSLTLPSASGGTGALTYSLTPAVPGLSFDPRTRRLIGTPTAAGDYNFIYTVTDEAGNATGFAFTISVVETGIGGAFLAQRIITTDADGAWSVHAADLDGDGDPDVLSASREDDKIAWYENLGGGDFSAQRIITTDADYAESVYAADLDGDGDPDVLSASGGDNKIAWYENLGDGEFSAQHAVETGISPGKLHAADLDGDGDSDILATMPGSNLIVWYGNLGDGDFSPRRVITREADGAIDVRAVDLDGDGDADVLSGSNGDDEIAWHENLGGGVFSAERVIIGLGRNNRLESMEVHAADLDGDGDADVLSASVHGTVWAENLGGGAFSQGRVINAGDTSLVRAVDLDGDGDADVLSSSPAGVSWHENLGGGAFSQGRVITMEADYFSSVRTADLDGDGDADLLSASIRDDTIAWYENLSNHGDDHGDTLSAATLVTALPAFLHGTLESGGDRDVFRIATGSGTLRVYSNGPTDTFGSLMDAGGGVLLQNDDSGDDGNFRLAAEVSAGTHYVEVRGYNDRATGPYTLSMEFVADRPLQFDESGPGDQSHEQGADVSLTLPSASGGTGALTYSLTPQVPGLSFDPGTRQLTGTPTQAGDYTLTYTVTDENGDATSFTFTISVAATAGGASFAAQRVITTDAAFANSVHAADLDGDGDPDVLSSSFNDKKIAWYENLGGDFSAQRVITTNVDAAESVYAADLDGDGDRDVLFASSSSFRPMIAWTENLGNGTFSDQHVISTNDARSVYAADLDGDGDPDVISASFNDDKIAWYENLGNGTFSDQLVISTLADRPLSVHAVDLDGDGDPDVLSASVGDDKIAWYENLGGGEFSAQRVIATNTGVAYSVHAADLDGDGDPDVLSASDSDDKIAWYENLGGGSFSGQRVISTSTNGARSVHAADLDGDGDPDVLSGSRHDDKIAWYENLGNGTFSDQRVISTDANSPRSVYAADLDGDGDPDVLSASVGDNKIAWYENLSNHGDDHGDTLSAATLVTALPAFLHGTLESGGDLDVFRVATGSGTLYVRSNGPTDTVGSVLGTNGAILAQDDQSGVANNFHIGVQVNAGTHYVEVRGRGAATGPYTLSIEFVSGESVADTEPQFDASSPGDQSHAQGSDVSLTLPSASGGNGTLTYTLTPAVPGLSFDPGTRRLSGTPTQAGDYTLTYTVTDEDGDATSFTFTLSVAAATGGGASFSAQRIITTDADGAFSVHAADLDGDGDPDVLSASRQDDKIVWYENLGGGEFSAQRIITTDADDLTSVYAADLDGDGDPDVLSASWGDHKVAWYENLGNGTFSDQLVISTDTNGRSVYAADVDGDGDPDVLSTSLPDRTIVWYENLGNGTFSDQLVISTSAEGVFSLRAADVDGDGDPDVLSASWEDDMVAWYENLGGGDFSAQRVITTDVDSADSVHAADLDGDGDPDVLSASFQDDKIAWYENLGGGNFSAQRVITTDADGAHSVHTADLDGDGDPDVLSASLADHKIAWYENLGNGEFSDQRVITTNTTFPRSVYAADLDGDGDPDVLSASVGDEKIAWYENLSNHGDDHGNTLSAATLVTALPAFLHGTLESGGDLDVFRVATGSGTLRVYSNGPTDMYGGVLDSDVTILDEDDDSGTETNFRVEVEVEAGTHYVVALGFNDTVTGPYTLSIEFVSSSGLQFDTGGPANQDYTAGTAVAALTLPAARGGSGSTTYSLTPAVPGLSFDPATRRLSGTPTAAGDYAMTYTATDANGNSISWTFTISVAAATGGGGVSFSTQRIITTDADFANSVHAADLDGDGDPDLLSTSQFDHKVAWYENLGGGRFSAQRVITTNADHAHSVYAADLDGDGDPDVLSASWRDTKVAWYENLGGGQFSAQRVITTDFRALSVHAADLDGDGDADVLAAAQGGTNISGIEWYENRDGAFTAHRIDNESKFAVYAADIDNDGDPDVLSASQDHDKVAWYQNLGGGSFSRQLVLDNVSFASDVHAADFDGDGDADVLAGFGRGGQDATDDEVAWYENLGGGRFTSRRTITTDVEYPQAVATADIDGDGDLDVFSASFNDRKFAWYENLGGGSFSSQRVIDTGGAPQDILAIDVDGDGDPDVLAASGYDDEVAWYENLSNHGDDHGDNTRATATHVTALPAFLHGTLESGNDYDGFRFTTGNGTLRVYTNGPTDTFGALTTPQTVIAWDDDGGNSTNFRIETEVGAGTKYVEVHSSSSTIGPYTLSIEFVAGATN